MSILSGLVEIFFFRERAIHFTPLYVSGLNGECILHGCRKVKHELLVHGKHGMDGFFKAFCSFP